MSHLKLEALARLVDEAPSPEERHHLEACEGCRGELEALKEQTAGLGTLPKMIPAPDRWPEVRAALADEGVIPAAGDGAGDAGWRGVGRRPGWARAARAAAASFLFLAGGAVGWSARGPVASPATMADAEPAAATAEGDRAVTRAGSRDAFSAALDQYMEASAAPAPDPAARLATLDHIVRTTAAALNESPGDPVINGYHLTAVAQRDELLRQLADSRPQPVF